MWQFVAGFSIGVYVGTYYDCKPALEFVFEQLKTNIPEKRGNERNESSS